MGRKLCAKPITALFPTLSFVIPTGANPKTTGLRRKSRGSSVDLRLYARLMEMFDKKLPC